MEKQKFWAGKPPARDDFGKPIVASFIDGKTRHGPWAIMTLQSWLSEGCGRFGLGFGQRYSYQGDGRWLKVEG